MVSVLGEGPDTDTSKHSNILHWTLDWSKLATLLTNMLIIDLRVKLYLGWNISNFVPKLMNVVVKLYLPATLLLTPPGHTFAWAGLWSPKTSRTCLLLARAPGCDSLTIYDMIGAQVNMCLNFNLVQPVTIPETLQWTSPIHCIDHLVGYKLPILGQVVHHPWCWGGCPSW